MSTEFTPQNDLGEQLTAASWRSLYDHYVLGLHDLGKQDTEWHEGGLDRAETECQPVMRPSRVGARPRPLVNRHRRNGRTPRERGASPDHPPGRSAAPAAR
jgi:hypothetical protein